MVMMTTMMNACEVKTIFVFFGFITVATDITWIHDYSNVLSVEYHFQLILLYMQQHKPMCLGNGISLITSQLVQTIPLMWPIKLTFFLK